MLVALESAGDKPTLFELGRMIAMHVAAASPIALDVGSVPADVLAREKAILEEKNAGKKPEMMEKIIAGGLKAYAQGKLPVSSRPTSTTRPRRSRRPSRKPKRPSARRSS